MKNLNHDSFYRRIYCPEGKIKSFDDGILRHGVNHREGEQPWECAYCG